MQLYASSIRKLIFFKSKPALDMLVLRIQFDEVRFIFLQAVRHDRRKINMAVGYKICACTKVRPL